MWVFDHSEGTPQRFDHLILATNAQVALQLLQDPAEMEREAAAVTLPASPVTRERSSLASPPHWLSADRSHYLRID